MKKAFLFILIFFAFSLLQVSFLPHFSFAGWVLNLVLILLVGISFFVPFSSGVASAVVGGFFLDVYSSLPFGFWLVLSLLVFFAARYVFLNHVRIPQGV